VNVNVATPVMNRPCTCTCFSQQAGVVKSAAPGAVTQELGLWEKPKLNNTQASLLLLFVSLIL